MPLLSSAHFDKTTIMFEPVVITKPEMIYANTQCRVDSFCKIEGGQGVIIGRFFHAASFCHLNIGGGGLVLGVGSSTGSGVRIITGSNVHGYGISCSAIHPDAQFKRGTTVICENAVIFAGATITPGCRRVGINAVVGAGAVVTKDVPDYEIWAGVPAKRIGDVRDTPTVVPVVAEVKPTVSDWVDRMADWDGHD